MAALHDVAHVEPLLRMRFPCVFFRELPEKVAFRYRADIMPFPVDHGDRRIAVMLHFFKALAHGVGVVYIGYTQLWLEKEKHVHPNSLSAGAIVFRGGELLL